ncbi:transglycosylase family protein [Arthrobacter sp. zg-Y820]|uniref:transglycosylase family protein n=1 Tax=unclassified Arthrobacter TaxID=235627 RepID=UPI001E36ABA3|nr:MULTISPECIES: transglycosylase family protein [unclassified Arthrobacter]MCC9197322.1 transglycosylase family protein [Arthrobacter sp. zg-Y820]MDK1280187.1 transglycosylase family protein [Arthrobacter sp. zg.Y820]MDK1360677.1 transglycosylase family protein [Arthrobacter sp. zg-Y1219]WIB09478.1 transglycosylase family protein [Arthrobacter sp. zg-Y820]
MTKSKISRNVRRGLAVAAISGAGLALTAVPSQAADASTWDALAQCESGGDWSINTGNGFSGGLQFTPSTWAAFGGTGDPSSASREQQIAVAERVLAGQGWGAWPACSAKLGLSGGATGSVSTESQAVAPATPEYVAPEQTTQQYVAPEQTTEYVAEAPVQETVPVETYAVPETPVVPEAAVPQTPVQVLPEAPAPAPAPVQTPAPALSGETYTVQSGDTLSAIAEKLGIEGGWPALYNANADTIIHADLIFTGQVLQLPA